MVQSITDVLGDQKRTVEQTRKIDIRALQRAGYFSAPKEGWQLRRIDGQITGNSADQLGRRSAHDQWSGY